MIIMVFVCLKQNDIVMVAHSRKKLITLKSVLFPIANLLAYLLGLYIFRNPYIQRVITKEKVRQINFQSTQLSEILLVS